MYYIILGLLLLVQVVFLSIYFMGWIPASTLYMQLTIIELAAPIIVFLMQLYLVGKHA